MLRDRQNILSGIARAAGGLILRCFLNGYPLITLALIR